MLTFDNVHYMLLWFFKKKWIKGPKMPGNHGMDYIDSRSNRLEVKNVFETVSKIKIIMSEFSPRQVSILKSLFTGATLNEISVKTGLTDRRVRQIRNETIKKLKEICSSEGILCCKHVFDDIKLA